MIDTDKYEGHTEGEWGWLYNDEVPVHLLVVPQDVIGVGVRPENNVSEADMKLIADAPLLLEEVKRMTRVLNMCKTTFDVLRETEFGRGMNWDTNEIFYQTAAHLNDWVSPEDNPDGWVGDLPPETVDELFTNAKEMIEEVKRLKKELAYYTDNCTVVWMPEDVLSLDDTLTDEQVSWVLGMMERKSAPEISWDTIEFWISEVKENET